MDSREEEESENIVYNSLNTKEKSAVIVISSVNNSIFVHLKDKLKHTEDSANDTISIHTSNLIEEEKLIFDTNNLTSKLNTDQIDQLRNKLLSSSNIHNLKDTWVELSQDSDFDIERNEISEIDIFEQEFYSRVKNQKLSSEQINLIRMKIEDQELTTKQLWCKFNVSASLISKIKRMKDFEIVRRPVRKIIKLNLKQKKILWKWINDIMKSNSYAIDWKDITVLVNNLIDTNYPIYFVRGFMKNELNYSFKRIKSRLNNIDMKKIKSIISLYLIKLNQSITSNTLVINVDESSLNRHIKYNYSWSMKGIPWEVKNSPFVGSASLCLAICSNGTWILLITNETINTNKFVLFLSNLNSWLKSNRNFGYEEVLLIMDNCKYHKTKETKLKLIDCSYKVIYLPPYTPQWAPIENAFGIIKKILIKRNKESSINLSKKSNYNFIIEAMKELNSEIIKKLFVKMFKLIGINTFN